MNCFNREIALTRSSGSIFVDRVTQSSLSKWLRALIVLQIVFAVDCIMD